MGNLSKESIIEYLTKYKNISEILRVLGYSTTTGGAYRTFIKLCKEFDINYKTFLEKTGKVSKKYELEELLIENSPCISFTSLKKRIIKNNLIKYVCNNCENDGNWKDKILVLQLDHKNGIKSDNRLENLQFLCPNCHSQTENYAGKNNKFDLKCKCGKERLSGKTNCQDCYNKNVLLRQPNMCMCGKKIKKRNKSCRECIKPVEYFCKCGERILKKSKICKKCYIEKTRIGIIKPSKEELEKELSISGYHIVAKKYNASESCIRKWFKQYKEINASKAQLDVPRATNS